MIAYAANKRWMVETGDTTVNGIAVPTDDQATFAVLATVAAGIEDNLITTVQQIDQGDWP